MLYYGADCSTVAQGVPREWSLLLLEDNERPDAGSTTRKPRPPLQLLTCSPLLQAHDARGQAVVTTMYLPLALRLIEKYISENEVDAEAGGRGGGVAPHYTALSLSVCVFARDKAVFDGAGTDGEN